jgi:protein-disulfide isomerase
MFCIVAFAILAVLGIFSASYRELAREALDCVLRRVTLRPCTTGFDQKMKSRILGSVINRSEGAARFLNKNFELLSWIFFMLMIASSIFAVRGVYLFYVTGSCSGDNETSFCLFDPKGENSKVTALTDSCRIKPTTMADLTLKEVNLSGAPTITGGGKGRILLIGCYGCSYSRKVYGPLKSLALRNNASFSFVDFPVKVRTNLMTRLGECVYRQDQGKYWKLNDILFSANPASLDDITFARKVTSQLGLDWNQIETCLNAPATQDAVTRQMDEVSKTNFFGTPTVFINDKPFVGPKPPRVYAIALKGPLYWMK